MLKNSNPTIEILAQNSFVINPLWETVTRTFLLRTTFVYRKYNNALLVYSFDKHSQER